MNIFVHNKSIESDLAMAKRVRMMATEDVLNELQLVEDNNNFEEPMMPGSNDEFSDCELEDEDLHDTTQLLPPQLSRQVVHQPFLLNGLPTLPHSP